MCGSVSGYIDQTPTPTPSDPADDCVVSQDKIYSGMDTDFLGLCHSLMECIMIDVKMHY